MSEFRLPITITDPEFTDRELDWDSDRRLWILSEKERGSVTWLQDEPPTPADLVELRDFFEIPSDVLLPKLRSMSPVELVAIHAQHVHPSRLRSSLCDCGKHWMIFKSRDSSWEKWGRDCNLMWSLGEAASPEETIKLASVA